MKRPRITMLALLCAMALGSVGANAHDPYPGLPGDSHHGGKHGDCAPWNTGNRDNDFALRMHHHHEMGAQLASAYLAGATDAQLRAAAQAHLTAHNTEKARLESWLTARNVAIAGPMGHPVWRYESFDRNGDGFIDSSERVATSPWHPHFPSMDANNDGRISRAESEAFHRTFRWDAWPYGTFVSVDRNGDGFVDGTEVVATSPWRPYLTPMDANRDGRVTRAEADAYTAAWRPGPWPGWSFVSVDANHDGFIDRTEVVNTSPLYADFDTVDSNDDSRATLEEIETYWRTMKHSGHAGHGAHCGPTAPDDVSHGRGESSTEVGDKGPPPSFRSLDSNGDGFLARDELPAGEVLLGNFTAADTNNDGRLSSGEVNAYHAARAEMGKDND